MFSHVSTIFPLPFMLARCEDGGKTTDKGEGKVSQRDNMMQP